MENAEVKRLRNETIQEWKLQASNSNFGPLGWDDAKFGCMIAALITVLDREGYLWIGTKIERPKDGRANTL